MAPVTTREISNVTHNDLLRLGLNSFAIELLVESYASPKRPPPLEPMTFVWRGVTVTLAPFEGPSEDGT